MSVLKLAESVHHLLFEVGSNLLDHLVNGGGLVVSLQVEPSVVEVLMA